MAARYKDRVTAHFALPEDLYKRLLVAASSNYRTATNECCFRLLESFRLDDEAAAAAGAEKRQRLENLAP